MTSATNPKQIAARNRQAKEDATAIRQTIEVLMSTIAGRRWVWLQLEAGQMFIAVGAQDVSDANYRNGLRDATLRLFAQVTRYTPAMYIRMTQENTQVQIEEQQNDGSSDTPDE